MTEDKTYHLYLDYKETVTGGGPSNEEDSGPYRSYEPTYKEVRFIKLARSSDKFFNHSIDVTQEIYNAENLYMAYAIYSDGDTFSTTYGLWHIIGLFLTEQEAHNALDNKKNGYGHKPWEGYFSSLDRFDVEYLKVWNK